MEIAEKTSIPKLILASGSQIRATILKNAGIPFDIIKTNTDEDSLKKVGLARGDDLETIAMDLAIAKARAIKKNSDHIILGSDQILEFEGGLFDKPTSMADAKERLYEMRNKSHSLINACVLVQDGEIIWQNIERPHLFLRDYSRQELDQYFLEADETILKSVGAYHVEGLGIRLFDHIEGDYYAVMGLPLSPVLKALRRFHVIGY